MFPRVMAFPIWLVLAVAIAGSAVATVLAAEGPVAVAGIDGATCNYVASGPPGARGNYLQIQQSADRVTISRSRRNLVVTETSARRQVECSGPASTVDNIDRIFLFSDSRRKFNARRERLDDIDVYVESIDYGQSSFHTGLAGGDNTIDGRGPGRLRPSGLSAQVHVGPGANHIFGPSGPGHLHTGTGPDLIVGGPNDDALLSRGGPDRLAAGPGDDRIRTSDEDVDTIDCGSGTDSVSAGAEDRLRDCESVSRF